MLSPSEIINAGRFVEGHQRGKKTRFKSGQSAHNYKPVGSVSIRIESTTGSPRAWIKVGEPNVWRRRATVNWESANGKMRRGFVLHHRDHNSLNDDPNNLVALTRSEHAKEHAGLHAWRRSFISADFIGEIRRRISMGDSDQQIADAMIGDE